MNDADFCPHYQTRIERLSLELTVALLPVRRCLLAERMVGFLKPHSEAAKIIGAISTAPDNDPPQCISGPDFDVIEHSRCSSERCAGSCMPSYREILAAYGIVDVDAPDCHSPAEESASTPH